MHFPRPPAFDHGVVSFLWALGLGLFVWFGLRAVDVGNATAFVVACVSAFAIFFVILLLGQGRIRETR